MGSVILTASGAANSPVTVPVTLNVTAAAQLSQIGGFAHIATGGGWDTTITLINLNASPAVARLRFWDNSGAALALTVAAGTSGVTASSFDQVLSPGASAVVDLQTQSASTLVGWVELDAPPGTAIAGFAVFQYQDSVTSSQGTSPLTTSTATALLVPYDNTGFTTGVALANQSGSTPANLSLKILDANGTTMATDSLSLAPNGHTSFAVMNKYPFAAGKRGVIDVSNQSGGVISGLGLRFGPTGSFTSLPVTYR
jgi:hypothetical protein